MKYIFGPVPSRRLGLSLGVDVTPYKTCTLDCVYCECGRTNHKTMERKPYVSFPEVMAELTKFLKQDIHTDYITFSGSGEPTLNSDLGKMIREIKNLTKIPVAVLTNGTMLFLPEVRKELLAADLVLPSLDSARWDSFIKVDRPVTGLSMEKIIEGIKIFKNEFKGKIWLEILFSRKMNDSAEDINTLIQVIRSIKPDKVQLNTVERPPAESFALPLEPKELTEIKKKFDTNGIKAEIIAAFIKKGLPSNLKENDLKEQILNVIKRRPETSQGLALALGIDPVRIQELIKEMIREKQIFICPSSGKKEKYYSFQKDN
ncbi:MAG: radical SAM protein [bacterium]|nr:radical SAM protein [bacterium]